MSTNSPLTGKAAAVTGAASGMGQVMALALAQEGARLAAIDVDAIGLAALAAEPDLKDTAPLAITADVSDLDACRGAVAKTVEEFGRLDILVNCAGVSNAPAAKGKPHPVRFWEMDVEGWRRVQEINHLGQFFMASLAVKHMLEAGWGRVVNVTTSYDTMQAVGMAAYGPAKSALEASTAIWAKELDGTGVTVNVLVPGGPTDTPFLPEEARRGTLISPEVMGAPIRWLASPASDGVTGCRFLAKFWDESLAPAEAAEKCRAPAAWPDLGRQATAERGFDST